MKKFTRPEINKNATLLPDLFGVSEERGNELAGIVTTAPAGLGARTPWQILYVCTSHAETPAEFAMLSFMAGSVCVALRQDLIYKLAWDIKSVSHPFSAKEIVNNFYRYGNEDSSRYKRILKKLNGGNDEVAGKTWDIMTKWVSKATTYGELAVGISFLGEKQLLNTFMVLPANKHFRVCYLKNKSLVIDN